MRFYLTPVSEIKYIYLNVFYCENVFAVGSLYERQRRTSTAGLPVIGSRSRLATEGVAGESQPAASGTSLSAFNQELQKN